MGRWLRLAMLAVTLGGTVAVASPPVPGKLAPVVSYDAERCCLLVDGQPFFAIGCYDTVPEYMGECSAAGFNLTTHTGVGDSPSRRFKETMAAGPSGARAAFAAYADAAQRAGMWALESPLAYVDYGAWPPRGTPQFDEFVAGLLRDTLPPVVEALRDHPAVLGFMGIDEPAPNTMAGALAAYYAAVKAIAPRRSVSVNFWWKMQDLPGAFDIATADCYPARDRTPLVRICEQTRSNAEAARRLRRPFWFVPLAESFEQGPALRPQEQVAQTYLAVVGGATGIVWWTWPVRHADSWAVLKRLAGELRTLAPALTERAPQPAVVLATPELQRTVQARVIRRGPVTFVIAVNAVPSPVDAEFRLPQSWAGKASVWFEGRTLTVSKGRWRDHFAGLERHVYALQTAWADAKPVELALVLSPTPVAEPAATPVAMPGNLLPDPSFETDEAWRRMVFPTDVPGNEGRRCFYDTGVRHSGRRSGALEFTDAGKAAAWDSAHVRLETNTLYRYGVWARMESMGTHHGGAVMTLVTATDNWAGGYYAEVQNYAGWQEYANLVWSGPDGKEAWMRCQYGGENAFEEPWTRGSGRIWFDDAYIVPAPAGVRNMVLNGGFEGEQWLPDWPAGWIPMFGMIGRPGCVGGAQPLWGIDRTVAWEGKASMRLVNPGPTTAEPLGTVARICDADYFLRGMALAAGKTYTLSAYMKSDRAGLSVVVISGGWMSCEVVRVTDTWQRYTLKCTPTATVAGHGFIGFQTREPGTLWIDGVQFEAGDVPTEYRCWQ